LLQWHGEPPPRSPARGGGVRVGRSPGCANGRPSRRRGREAGWRHPGRCARHARGSVVAAAPARRRPPGRDGRG